MDVKLTLGVKKYLIKAFMGRWVYLLGLEGWDVKWRTGKKIEGNSAHPPYGDAECFSDQEAKTATIFFDLKRMTSAEKIERTTIHELLHLLHPDKDIDNVALHQFIRRMERTIRRIRLRSGGVI